MSEVNCYGGIYVKAPLRYCKGVRDVLLATGVNVIRYQEMEALRVECMASLIKDGKEPSALGKIDPLVSLPSDDSEAVYVLLFEGATEYEIRTLSRALSDYGLNHVVRLSVPSIERSYVVYWTGLSAVSSDVRVDGISKSASYVLDWFLGSGLRLLRQRLLSEGQRKDELRRAYEEFKRLSSGGGNEKLFALSMITESLDHLSFLRRLLTTWRGKRFAQKIGITIIKDESRLSLPKN